MRSPPAWSWPEPSKKDEIHAWPGPCWEIVPTPLCSIEEPSPFTGVSSPTSIAGSKPNANGVWSPKDMLFFGPDEEIPSDLQQPGTWSYPHGSRREISTWYNWEGDEIITYQKTEIFYMDTVTSFTVKVDTKS